MKKRARLVYLLLARCYFCCCFLFIFSLRAGFPSSIKKSPICFCACVCVSAIPHCYCATHWTSVPHPPHHCHTKQFVRLYSFKCRRTHTRAYFQPTLHAFIFIFSAFVRCRSQLSVGYFVAGHSNDAHWLLWVRCCICFCIFLLKVYICLCVSTQINCCFCRNWRMYFTAQMTATFPKYHIHLYSSYFSIEIDVFFIFAIFSLFTSALALFFAAAIYSLILWQIAGVRRTRRLRLSHAISAIFVVIVGKGPNWEKFGRKINDDLIIGIRKAFW